ncbi:TPA: hypothetical protein ACGGNX_000859 [Escherichia coli]
MKRNDKILHYRALN